jgi:hypothetical protein
MAPRPPHPRAARRPWSARATARSRGALTLIEIAFSLVILVFGVVSAMLLFPAGLKAQQLSRFQLYACAKAQEMIDSFNSSHNANPAIDTEAFNPWDVPVSRRTQAWDLEERLSSNSFGMLPLPTDIAKRLDSDGDEIQRILSEGGYLYYSQPMATTNLQESSLQTTPANEAQRLVCAVSGYAQNNALHIFPWKNWPYVTPYPSPPIHGLHYPDFLPPRGAQTPTTFRWVDSWTDGKNADGTDKIVTANDGKTASYCWEETSDPDIQKVFSWRERNDSYGYFPYCCGTLSHKGSGIDPTQPATSQPADIPSAVVPDYKGALRYFEAALWYCKQKGLRPEFYNPPPDVLALYNPVAPSLSADRDFPFEPGTKPEDRWQQVQAMRFLAHAATCLTRWYSAAELGAQSAPGDIYTGIANPTSTDPIGTDPRLVMLTYAYTAGVNIPNVKLDALTGPLAFADVQPSAPGDAVAPSPPSIDHATPAAANQFSRLTHHHILYYHERCLRLVMAYAAANPYDWGAPRPLQRSIMTDFPLFESDLFGNPQVGLPFNVTDVAKTSAQWKPIPGQPISNLGRGYMFPGYAPPGMPYDAAQRIPDSIYYQRAQRPDGSYYYPQNPDGTYQYVTDKVTERHAVIPASPSDVDPFWGNPAHFTLTAKFTPDERCREIVFWMVDWQSYEDFELAPSAPVDAARYPFAGPLLDGSVSTATDPNQYATLQRRMSNDDSMPTTNSHPTGIEFRDEQLYTYRNPEKVLLFKTDVSDKDTGYPLVKQHVDTTATPNKLVTDYSFEILNESGTDQGLGTSSAAIAPGDANHSIDARAIFRGQWGADRNFNKRLDRGPVPRSVRLRAVPVARFLYYDPRVPAMIH